MQRFSELCVQHMRRKNISYKIGQSRKIRLLNLSVRCTRYHVPGSRTSKKSTNRSEPVVRIISNHRQQMKILLRFNNRKRGTKVVRNQRKTCLNTSNIWARSHKRTSLTTNAIFPHQMRLSKRLKLIPFQSQPDTSKDYPKLTEKSKRKNFNRNNNCSQSSS